MSDAVTGAQEHPRTSPLRVGAALAGVVLAAVVVFGLGVMVGKRVVESGPAVSPPPAVLPTESLPPLPAAPAPAASVPPESLTFYDRLSGVAPPPPLPPPPEDQAPPQAASPPPAALAAAPRDAQAPAAADRTAAEAQIKRLSGRGPFAVQVSAVNDKADAEETAARIRRQGFAVVTVKASVKGRVWYRVRVGGFPTKQAATQAAGIFRSAYGYDAMAVHD